MRLLLLPFFVVLAATGQTKAPPSKAQPAKAQPSKQPPPGTLHAMVVTGNHLYNTDEILKQTGLHPGQPITPAAVEAARQALQDLQLFSNVSDRFRFTPAPVQYTVTFEVAEIEQVLPIRFERLPGDPEDLRNYLRSHVPLYADQIPGSEIVLNRYREAVQTFVAKNDPSLHVKAVPTSEPKGETIVFSPVGAAVTISVVRVSGNEAIDSGTLLRAINSAAIGAPYTDARVAQICEGTIKPLYAAHGYMAVTFPSIRAEPSKTDRGVNVSMEIKEGPQFKFGPVRFHGSGLDPDEVRSAIPFRPGQTFDGDKVVDFRIDLQHRLRRRGFLDTSVTADTQVENGSRTVNVIYNVVPGSLYTFAKLDIKGLDLTSEPVVEQLWGEKPGKPFNPDYPDFFLKRIEEDRMFDRLANTSADYTADASTHSVVVHLYFKGGDSKLDLEKKKKEEQDKQKVDGGWSPY